MYTKLYERLKKIIKEKYKFFLAILVLIVFFFYELPFVIYRPGGTIDLSNRIIMEDAYTQSGKMSMAYVTMTKGNIPFVLLSFLLPNWDLEKTENITLENESIEDTIKRDRLYLEEGLDNAIISAYTLAGKYLKIKNIYHVVTYIANTAKTNLQVGDIILSIDNKEFNTLQELQGYINSLKKGEKVDFIVSRNNKKITCTATIYEIENTLKVGISIINKYEYDKEPNMEIKTESSESGSSGGLMTSLSIYNALTEMDITKGRNIVGTGTIDINGNVGEIGGIKYKLLGAEKAHADIFLCPKENYEEANLIKEKNNLQLKLISVASLKEAIEELLK